MLMNAQVAGFSWITPKIAIGALKDVERAATQVTAVLSLVALPKTVVLPADVDHLQVPLTDGAGNSKQDVRNAVRYLTEFMRDGEHVFVHCHAGRSRSVVILAMALMQHLGISRGAALGMIEKQREIALSPGVEQMFRHAEP
jgi:protein-tyrosine phosphatase